MTDQKKVHASGIFSNDCTLCGFAYEGEVFSSDPDNAPLLAPKGYEVTCDQCLVIIRYCKAFKGNRQP